MEEIREGKQLEIILSLVKKQTNKMLEIFFISKDKKFSFKNKSNYDSIYPNICFII